MPHCYICDVSPTVTSEYSTENHKSRLEWDEIAQGYVCVDCLEASYDANQEFEDAEGNTISD